MIIDDFFNKERRKTEVSKTTNNIKQRSFTMGKVYEEMVEQEAVRQEKRNRRDKGAFENLFILARQVTNSTEKAMRLTLPHIKKGLYIIWVPARLCTQESKTLIRWFVPHNHTFTDLVSNKTITFKDIKKNCILQDSTKVYANHEEDARKLLTDNVGHTDTDRRTLQNDLAAEGIQA